MPIYKVDKIKNNEGLQKYRVRVNYNDELGHKKQLNMGINIQQVAKRLGHTKVEITWNTYSYLYPREEERAIEILNAV